MAGEQKQDKKPQQPKPMLPILAGVFLLAGLVIYPEDSVLKVIHLLLGAVFLAGSLLNTNRKEGSGLSESLRFKAILDRILGNRPAEPKSAHTDPFQHWRNSEKNQYQRSPGPKPPKPTASDPILVQEYLSDLAVLRMGRSQTDNTAAMLAAIAIHMAKVDGHISESEIETIRNSVSNEFLSADAQGVIAQTVKRTKEHIYAIGVVEIPASIIAVIDSFDIKSDREGYKFLFILLFEVIIADGESHNAEEELFDFLCDYYEIPDVEALKRLARFYHGAGKESPEPDGPDFDTDEPIVDASDFYENIPEFLVMFQLERTYTKNQLQAAWKRLVVLHHPDRFHNDDPHIYEAAHERFIKLQKAYETLEEACID